MKNIRIDNLVHSFTWFKRTTRLICTEEPAIMLLGEMAKRDAMTDDMVTCFRCIAGPDLSQE